MEPFLKTEYLISTKFNYDHDHLGTFISEYPLLYMYNNDCFLKIC